MEGMEGFNISFSYFVAVSVTMKKKTNFVFCIAEFVTV